MVCRRKVDAESIRGEIFNQTIPMCGECPQPLEDQHQHQHLDLAPDPPPPAQLPVMKPDIVFFGEGLPDHFHDCISRSGSHLMLLILDLADCRDKSQCDLLIVIGSSLKVRPVALIPSSLPSEVPQILINRWFIPLLQVWRYSYCLTLGRLYHTSRLTWSYWGTVTGS